MIKPKPNEIYPVGNKLFAVCPECDQFVRIDKPIFGSFHFCLTDEEKRIKHCQNAYKDSK